jgi:hypothetical protein
MKGIYKNANDNKLTVGKEYFIFEIAISIRNKAKLFRVVDDLGIPALYSVDSFETNKFETDGMTALFDEAGMTITLRELAVACENDNVNSLWEKYFDNEKETVDFVNGIIRKYAAKDNVTIVSPSPYGTEL